MRTFSTTLGNKRASEQHRRWPLFFLCRVLFLVDKKTHLERSNAVVAHRCVYIGSRPFNFFKPNT